MLYLSDPWTPPFGTHASILRQPVRPYFPQQVEITCLENLLMSAGSQE